MKLSVVIITFNEAHNIVECLESVAFASQRIIVDSGSTDGTVALARAAGATVIETGDWPGFGPQKNRALSAADENWVLSLDADERIPAALAEEIQAAVAGSAHTFFALPRLSSFCGRLIYHGGWYPDYVIRLFRRDHGRFSDDLVHERVVATGSGGKLKTPIHHTSYRDDDDVLRKLAHYSTLGARQSYTAGKRSTLSGAIAHAAAAFLRSYVFKRGFLDGQAGLMVAISSTESTYHKYLKLMLLSENKPSASRSPE